MRFRKVEKEILREQNTLPQEDGRGVFPSVSEESQYLLF